MYVDVSSVQQNGKTYTRYLLRESYREGRQVKHRTIANLNQCSPKEIERRFSQVESAPISRDLEPIKPTAHQVLSKVVSFRFTFP